MNADSLHSLESSPSVTTGNVVTVTTQVIPPSDVFTDAGDPRVSQQTILPQAVKSRMLGDLFSNAPDGFSFGTGISTTVAIPSANTIFFKFTLSNNQQVPLVAVPDVAFFITDGVTPGTFWGAANGAYGMGLFPTSVFNSWADTDNYNVVTMATGRNQAGGTLYVTGICRFRIIANTSAAQGGSGNIAGSNAAPPGKGGIG